MSDLTTKEQANVRIALRFLRTRCGTWAALAQALGSSLGTVVHAGTKQCVSASLAVRVARLAGVPVDDVLTGRYPPEGICPHCGHHQGAFTEEATIP